MGNNGSFVMRTLPLGGGNIKHEAPLKSFRRASLIAILADLPEVAPLGFGQRGHGPLCRRSDLVSHITAQIRASCVNDAIRAHTGGQSPKRGICKISYVELCLM